ncbi:MAG TPA: polymer-forming cytoskeletal protein [Usitatibacter sp.]|nr:polymer-forming cytoskeletal protein [Usitatibacter sp.]
MRYAEGILNRARDARAVAATAPTLAPAPSQAATPAALPPQQAPRLAEGAAPRSDEGGGSKLIVGPNIKLKGVEIDDCDTLVVEGRVEATMVSRTIQIAESGAFSGKVDVDVAEIRGAFQGEMTARKKLVVHSSGRINGKIRYGKMLVQEGGEMSGDVAALGAETGDGPGIRPVTPR